MKAIIGLFIIFLIELVLAGIVLWREGDVVLAAISFVVAVAATYTLLSRPKQ